MNILIDMPVHEPLLKELESIPGLKIKVVDPPGNHIRELPKELIDDTEVMFCTFPPINHREMSKLKFIQISSSGYKQLIGQGFIQRNVRASNARGVFDIPIAEWNIAMMVNLARDIRQILHNQDQQIWDRSPRFQFEIRGLTVGIWGYGGIGRETARLAKSMGLKIYVLSRKGITPRKNIYCVDGTGDEDGVLPDKVFLVHEKEKFLKSIDFLLVAMPQTDDNQGIIGRHELSLLKPSTFLLNPARGELIEEQDLINVLQNHKIAGAALDTHYYYPMPPNHPFWKMPNVILTPHISGSSGSPKFLERIWEIFVQNVKHFQKDGVLLNELTINDLKN